MSDQPDEERIRGERFVHLFRKCKEIVSHLQTCCGCLTAEREDMEQEMALALAELPARHTGSYCLCRAAWAAVAWLRTTFGTQLVHRVETRPDMAELVDSGACLLVWADGDPVVRPTPKLRERDG